MAFTLPKLPYDYDALSPHMSADTLKFHHDKHHKAYVDKLNKAVEGTPYAELSLAEIIQKSWRKDPEVFNNAGQHWNHTFFWQCMQPDGGGKPDGNLAQAIERDLGDFATFREKFIETGMNRFGSGWAWLVVDAGKLAVISTPNGEPPMVSGRNALLACDVWEHAYYLDYQNRREEFITAFLDHLANWEFAAEQLRIEGEGSYTGAHAYGQGVEKFARSGKVADAARAARTAYEGAEGDALRRAEEVGRSHSRGEDRQRRAAAKPRDAGKSKT
jgi:superoxide dismutase, Fe-Mn family